MSSVPLEAQSESTTKAWFGSVISRGLYAVSAADVSQSGGLDTKI
jgi:hypothetical protein